MENEGYALWLMPAAPEQKIFESVIADLAARFDAPIFEPHATLIGAIKDREQALNALDSVARRGARTVCELTIGGIHSEEKFTKTLFVRFVLSAELVHLRRVVLGELAVSDEDVFDPHLSLLYRKMESDEKRALAQEIRLPFAGVVFDGLKLIAHPWEIRTRADVEAWRILGECSLTSNG